MACRGRVPGARASVPAVVGCVLDALAPPGGQLPVSTPASAVRPTGWMSVPHGLRRM